ERGSRWPPAATWVECRRILRSRSPRKTKRRPARTGVFLCVGERGLLLGVSRGLADADHALMLALLVVLADDGDLVAGLPVLQGVDGLPHHRRLVLLALLVLHHDHLVLDVDGDDLHVHLVGLPLHLALHLATGHDETRCERETHQQRDPLPSLHSVPPFSAAIPADAPTLLLHANHVEQSNVTVSLRFFVRARRVRQRASKN